MNNFYYLQISISLQFLTINLNKYNITHTLISKIICHTPIKIYKMLALCHIYH